MAYAKIADKGDPISVNGSTDQFYPKYHVVDLEEDRVVCTVDFGYTSGWPSRGYASQTANLIVAALNEYTP